MEGCPPVNIAVVSAYPIGLNTGMLTSDLALRSFLSRRGIAAQLTTFSIGPPLTILGSGDGPGGVRYKPLASWEDLKGFDRIIFWGDFLHSRRFHQQDLPWMVANESMNLPPDALNERVFSALMLEHAPDAILQKVICFGGTIYINSLSDADDKRYIAALSRLFSSARLVLMRDPVSAALAARYGARGTTQGVDCALLLEPFGNIDWRRSRKAPAALAFSFGRGPSRRKSTRRLMRRLVAGLDHALNSKEQLSLEWLSQNDVDPVAGLLEKLELLHSRSAVVVTDTYHCAVNAWREGIPAVCIGLGAEHPSGTLADKKKELFLNMFGGGDFYVYSEELRAWGGVRRTTERLSTVLAHWEPVTASIRAATERAEAVLADAVTT